MLTVLFQHNQLSPRCNVTQAVLSEQSPQNEGYHASQSILLAAISRHLCIKSYYRTDYAELISELSEKMHCVVRLGDNSKKISINEDSDTLCDRNSEPV
jgi:hypothetical protein